MADPPGLDTAKTQPDRPQPDTGTPDALYERIAADYGVALERLARGYERDPERRRDLLQEVHIAVWRSLLILMSFLTNARFPHTAPAVMGGLSYVGSTVAILVVAKNRWQREATALQAEIESLRAGE